MRTQIDILPCKLGNAVDGCRVALSFDGGEHATKPFLNFNAALDHVEELLDQHDVDVVCDLVTKPGTTIYFDMSDDSYFPTDTDERPIVSAEVIPLFPNDGGKE